MRRFVAAIALGLAALQLVSCGGGGSGAGGTSAQRCDTPPLTTPGPGQTNLFANGGFEEGANPWCSLATAAWGPPFAVSATQAHGGGKSAYLRLRSADGGSARVYGVVTEIATDAFPEQLSGYYYVDGWQQGTAKQYLQFVVIVWGAANQPASIAAPNYQIRYVLAGVDSQPLEISNARYVLVGHGAPEQGHWVHFQRNVREDFQQLWGAAPEGFSKLRILFETRWDDRSPTDGPSSADVYYDDLYLGPAAAP